LPIFAWCQAKLTSETQIEIGDMSEAAEKYDVGDSFVGVFEQVTSAADSQFADVGGQGHASAGPEESAECPGA